MSCCPPGSIGSFYDEYTPIGTKQSLSDVEFYHVGNPNTDKAIIMVPDVFGWDSGRIRRYADLLSEIAGYVVVPKLLQPPFEEGTDGDGLPPTFDVSARWSDFVSYMSQFKYNEVLKPKIDGLINHLRSNGVSKIGLMGFCFGGWVICNIVRDHGDVISCAVIPHPSIGLEEKIYGGDCVALVDNVKCPVLLMPAGNDPPTYLPGGDIYETLVKNNSNSKSVHFTDMAHGFCNRGDISSDVKVQRDVAWSMSLAQNYFREHLMNAKHCCCPPGSIGSFYDEYTPIGTKQSLLDVEFYHVGNPNTDKAIIMVPDVFGWDSGRIRRYADLLSEIAGYVVVPKLLQPPFEEGTDGDGLPPTFDVSARWSDFVSYMSQFKYNEVLKPKIDGLINHLRSNGVSKIGLMGFCFGGWVICNIVRDHGDVISCAVIPHPSIGLEEKIYGGNCVALVDHVKCPVLLMPAGNDPPTYLPEGEIYEALVKNNSNSKSVHFPDMIHGFSNRADISTDEKIQRDVMWAFSLTQDYFRKHLL